MFLANPRILLILAVSGIAPALLFSQSVPAVPAAPKRIEAGLETAVDWKWWVVPSNPKEWGFALPEADPEQPEVTPGSPAAPGVPIIRPDSYEVVRGDALALIARKFAMSVDQLKEFNGLTSDLIRIGQVLKIPSRKELQDMAPPPEPEPPQTEKKKPKAAPKPQLNFQATREMENALLQIFLDRENFSNGPIDGFPGSMFEKALELYRSIHEDAHGEEALRQKALSVVGEPFIYYTLKPEDFRFIAPPKAAAAGSSKSKSSRSKQEPPPPPTYEELVAASYLAYRTPWEFIAERFHCDVTFLQHLNYTIKDVPEAGTDFKVPNVIPFEIETALNEPLQPAADPEKPVVATVVDLSWLEIRQGDKLVATMPLTLARPDLRGRGSWTVLDVIPGPRLATKQELKEQPKPKFVSPLSLPTAGLPAADPEPKPALAVEQHIAAGPNNPVGILWINLAKSKSTDPLPYGLHGTSIPGRMKRQESIGGLRLANWDIARAVRLLPAGTPLQWK